MAMLRFAERENGRQAMTVVAWRDRQSGMFTRRGPVRRYISDGHWQPPTADSLEYHLVRVVKGERTCLECGETFPAGGFCVRCGLLEPGQRAGNQIRADKLPPNVATDSYLLPEEYRIIT